MGFLKKEQLPILFILIIVLIIFTIVFVSRKNYEFIMYIGIIIFFLLVILFTNKRINYPNIILWGMTVWAILHMSGGGIFIGGKKLYEIILLPIVGPPYNIFRYDQFVHIIGFGVATLLMYHLLKPSLRIDTKKWISILIVIVMAGLGVGAFNEIVEFFATVVIPETGVGGYVNTSLDLVADLAGAIIALIYILIIKDKKYEQ